MSRASLRATDTALNHTDNSCSHGAYILVIRSLVNLCAVISLSFLVSIGNMVKVLWPQITTWLPVCPLQYVAVHGEQVDRGGHSANPLELGDAHCFLMTPRLPCATRTLCVGVPIRYQGLMYLWFLK